jgi:curli biogenesis system outer membrane secretion channel CsgG
VPTGATAAVLNVTAVAPSASTYLTLYPQGAPPTTSDLNPPTGGVLANMAVTTLASGGSFDVYNAAGNTNVVIDLAGWYSPGAV